MSVTAGVRTTNILLFEHLSSYYYMTLFCLDKECDTGMIDSITIVGISVDKIGKTQYTERYQYSNVQWLFFFNSCISNVV